MEESPLTWPGRLLDRDRRGSPGFGRCARSHGQRPASCRPDRRPRCGRPDRPPARPPAPGWRSGVRTSAGSSGHSGPASSRRHGPRSAPAREARWCCRYRRARRRERYSAAGRVARAGWQDLRPYQHPVEGDPAGHLAAPDEGRDDRARAGIERQQADVLWNPPAEAAIDRIVTLSPIEHRSLPAIPLPDDDRLRDSAPARADIWGAFGACHFVLENDVENARVFATSPRARIHRAALGGGTA